MRFLLNFNPLKGRARHFKHSRFYGTFNTIRSALVGELGSRYHLLGDANSGYAYRLGILDYLLVVPVLLVLLFNQLDSRNEKNLSGLLQALAVGVGAVIYAIKWLISIPLTLIILPFIGVAHAIGHLSTSEDVRAILDKPGSNYTLRDLLSNDLQCVTHHFDTPLENYYAPKRPDQARNTLTLYGTGFGSQGREPSIQLTDAQLIRLRDNSDVLNHIAKC